MEAIQQIQLYSKKVKIISLLFFTCPIMLYVLSGEFLILYADLIVIHLLAFILGLRRFILKKKRLDIEIAMLIAMVDMVTRFFLPHIFNTINNIIIFSFIFIFIYRNTQLIINRENSVYLVGYSLFYFLLNLKYLDFSTKGIVEVLYSMILSGIFAYTLQVTSKQRNFYRSTLCAGFALLCLVLLGKRAIDTLYNAFVIAQVSVSILLIYSYIYWYEGKEYYAGTVEKRGPFYNVKLLPDLIGGLAFVGYVLEIKVDNITAIWCLVTVVFIWYILSIIASLTKIDTYSDGAIACEELSKKQIKRLDKHVQHLQAANYLLNQQKNKN